MSPFALRYPHLEEAYRFAELVFPKFGADRFGAHANNGPFGEMDAKREAHADEDQRQRTGKYDLRERPMAKI